MKLFAVEAPQYKIAVKPGSPFICSIPPSTIFKIRAKMDESHTSRATEGHAEESSCAACQRPDSAEDMVQCDHCDVWKHYSCAAVNASVAGRSFVCGDCTAPQIDDVISVQTGSSRSSSTSTFSVCLSQLVERQQVERARVEVQLQRRHLDEQQRLIDEVLNGAGELSNGAIDKTISSACSMRIATPPPPGAPVGATARQSTTTMAPGMVYTPLTTLNPNTVRSLRTRKDPRTTPSDVRNRIELCENRADPTPEQLTELHSQLELCRKLLERFQTTAAANESLQQSGEDKPMKEKPSQSAASMSRVVSQTGTIPKANRSLYAVTEEDRMHSDYQSDTGAVGRTTSPNETWPLKHLVGQTDQPPVSRAAEPTEIRPNDMELPGKRQAFNHSIENTIKFVPDHCPTTNNRITREQLRFVARPNEMCSPPNNFREQLRNFPAHLNDFELPGIQRKSQSTGLKTSNHPPRAIDTSRSPRLSESYQQSQDIPQQDPVRLTQQQLAARQSLAKDLPRFSGDPAEWPIFISNYRYTTEACGFSDGENMLRLQRCLVGSALETVRSRLVLPAAVPRVIETLRLRFGRPELLINALLRKVREIPAPKSDKLEGLIDFGMAVQALCDHIEAANERAHLSNPSLLQELVAKLPADQRMMWAGYKRGFQQVDLKTFGDYMASVVRDAISVVDFESDVKQNSPAKNKGFINSHETETYTYTEESIREKPKQYAPEIQEAENHTHRQLASSTLFRIIPVTLHGRNGSIDTFAFLDEGSDLTLIESDLATSLGVQGTPQPLRLRWTGNTTRVEKDSHQITVDIAGIGQSKLHKLLNARTVSSLGLPRQSFAMEEAEKKHKHLQGIPITSYRNAVPKILIGVDNLRRALPLEVREGIATSPVAVKTRLGWCVYGPGESNKQESYNFHIRECVADERYGPTKKFNEIEAVYTIPVAIPSTSEEDQVAKTIELTSKPSGDSQTNDAIWKRWTDVYFKGMLGSEEWQRLVVEAQMGVHSRPLTCLPLIAEQPKVLELNHDEESVAAVQLQFRKLVGRANLGRPWKPFQRQSGENRKSTSRDGRNPGRNNRKISNPDNQRQQKDTIQGEKAFPASWLTLLDLQGVSEVPENSGLHPGETVAAEVVQLAALLPSVTEAPRPTGEASRQDK
ncbi:uncharacterized protein LOC134288451 [Aedes albopictus]|uniref:PHD-type domain-containing protein n=1 Tax=Aedes albopictus TaxID=7160 RepID=A0ABM1Z6N0_AEDAL